MMIWEKRKKGKHNFFSRKRGGVMSIGEYLKSIFSLEGKTILISGATGGIGSAISRGLAAAGAETALCARNQQKEKNWHIA